MHLGPRIVRMIVHPVLGTVATQMEPSLLLKSTPGLMSQLQCELTTQEQTLARWSGTKEGGMVLLSASRLNTMVQQL